MKCSYGQVVVGRMVPGHSVDIDASLESVCSKVSRKHIVFHYKDSASTKGWQLENVGKRGITIDGSTYIIIEIFSSFDIFSLFYV